LAVPVVSIAEERSHDRPAAYRAALASVGFPALLALEVAFAEWIAQQITEAFPWDEAPAHLIRDRDARYDHPLRPRLSAMGIRDHPIASRSPWQNGHAERLISSIRRECLDHMVIVGEDHLRRVFRAYAAYYNGLRTHLSLGKDAPAHRPIQRLGQVVARPILGGLHHQCCRI
jgi:transposase InsO family protein